MVDKYSIHSHIIKRISNSSGLVQLFSYLCDVIIPTDGGFRYIEEVPINYISEFNERTFFTVHMEYGFTESDDMFARDRARHDNRYGYASKFLHPVVKKYVNCDLAKKQKTFLKCTCGAWIEKTYIMDQISPCKNYNEPWDCNVSCPKCSTGAMSSRTLRCLDTQHSNKIYEHHVNDGLQLRYDEAYAGDDFYTKPLREFLDEMLKPQKSTV